MNWRAHQMSLAVIGIFIVLGLGIWAIIDFLAWLIDKHPYWLLGGVVTGVSAFLYTLLYKSMVGELNMKQRIAQKSEFDRLREAYDAALPPNEG